ncbi:IS3 family transposase, partial [Corynebacterium diphtheriae]|uniref:IS3 family transposase n=1 Tax=Corynebacterium diphtheriae TaxID=1717 RepID=UPI0011B1CBF5
ADTKTKICKKNGLIVHTDQGFQYQHASWRTLSKSVGGVQSMSRKGNCYDYAVMENFFGHLKSEMFYGASFTSVDELCQAIDEYILWYNT